MEETGASAAGILVAGTPVEVIREGVAAATAGEEWGRKVKATKTASARLSC
jgi:hypothetical protein